MSRTVWIWSSAVLAVVVIAAVVWGLSVRSDLDDANAQVAQLEAENAVQDGGETEAEPDPAVAALKAAYAELTAQLGTATDDLASATADLEQAQTASAQAEQAAAAAKEKAGDVKGAVEQAQATADQAQLEAEAARAKGAVIADCAKASFSVVGELLEGGALSTVRDAVQDIAADCKTALAEG